MKISLRTIHMLASVGDLDALEWLEMMRINSHSFLGFRVKRTFYVLGGDICEG